MTVDEFIMIRGHGTGGIGSAEIHERLSDGGQDATGSNGNGVGHGGRDSAESVRLSGRPSDSGIIPRSSWSNTVTEEDLEKFLADRIAGIIQALHNERQTVSRRNAIEDEFIMTGPRWTAPRPATWFTLAERSGLPRRGAGEQDVSR